MGLVVLIESFAGRLQLVCEERGLLLSPPDWTCTVLRASLCYDLESLQCLLNAARNQDPLRNLLKGSSKAANHAWQWCMAQHGALFSLPPSPACRVVKLLYGLDGRRREVVEGLPPPPDWLHWARVVMGSLQGPSAFPLSVEEVGGG